MDPEHIIGRVGRITVTVRNGVRRSPIRIMVTDRSSVADQWARDLCRNPNEFCPVGLHIFRNGYIFDGSEKVDVVALQTDDRALIFQTKNTDGMVRGPLASLLGTSAGEPIVFFHGYAPGSYEDGYKPRGRALSTRYRDLLLQKGFYMENNINIFELAAKKLDNPDLERATFDSLVSTVTGFSTQQVISPYGLNYAEEVLTMEQVIFATITSFATLQIGKTLLSSEDNIFDYVEGFEYDY